ncbi:MAG: hypothetical protein FWG66_01190, partial [Spirochaetes bacterium]|nr:hypothetical protein [Spirochaetota bacterium]
MKIKFVICTIVALFVLSGASVWEGAAAIAAGESLPPTGFYVATNSFPMNTVVDIVNLENGRSVRAVVTSRLESPGLLAVVSRETGSMLGLGVQSLGRVSMTQPAGPVAHSSFAENGAWQPPAPAPFAVAVTEEITPADLPSAELPLADEPSAELPPADLPLAELPPAELPLADALVADDAAEPLAAAEQPPSVVVVVEHPGQQIPGQQPGLQPSQQPSQQPAGQVAVEHWQELPEQPAATEAPVLPPPQPAITEAPALPTPPPQPAITEAPVQPTPPPQP